MEHLRTPVRHGEVRYRAHLTVNLDTLRFIVATCMETGAGCKSWVVPRWKQAESLARFGLPLKGSLKSLDFLEEAEPHFPVNMTGRTVRNISSLFNWNELKCPGGAWHMIYRIFRPIFISIDFILGKRPNLCMLKLASIFFLSLNRFLRRLPFHLSPSIKLFPITDILIASVAEETWHAADVFFFFTVKGEIV